MKGQRKILQRLLMLLVVLSGLTVVAATLRGRPKVSPPDRVAAPYKATDFAPVLTQLNRSIADEFDTHQLQIASAADNLTVARRLSLALVGSGMSLEEIRAFQAVPQQRQLQWWTEYLLQDRRWADYFAERLSRAYVGTSEGPFLLFRRRKFNAWLADQLHEGTGYDVIVREMVASDGLWTDTPQVNFITATMDDANKNRADPIRLAGRTSRAFLAQRIDCLQCHDDFIGELNLGEAEDVSAGTQEHFHHLAAFYSGTALNDPPFSGITEDDQPYEFQFLGESEERTVEPTVPFASSLLPSDGAPRQRLAEWITHPKNFAFARATVNRLWALMFSRPLVEPVDSIPLYEPVPEALEVLSEYFAAQRYDIKRLIRIIASSDAFRRESRADFEIDRQHEQTWAVFPITQLRPEQVAYSMFQASKLTAIDASSSIFTRLKAFGDTQDFLKRFGDRGEDEFESESVTISQRLVLMNGGIVTERTKVDLVNNASSRIAILVPDDRLAIELSFLTVLNRLPTDIERDRFAEHLLEKTGNQRSKALGDIFWAMFNSTEFSWNH